MPTYIARLRRAAAGKVLAVIDFGGALAREFIDTRGELQTCPKRRELSTDVAIVGRDRWLTTRWHWTHHAHDRAAQRFGLLCGVETWPTGEPQPRTCSYCGSIHPDDAVTLIMRGWDVELTANALKRHLVPPGCGRAARSVQIATRYARIDYLKHTLGLDERSAIARELREQRAAPKRRELTPIPPVELHIAHFDYDQRERFNVAMRTQDARLGA